LGVKNFQVVNAQNVEYGGDCSGVSKSILEVPKVRCVWFLLTYYVAETATPSILYRLSTKKADKEKIPT